MRDRRQFLKLLAAGAAVTARPHGLIAAQAPPAPPQRPLTTLRKSTLISMLPKEGSYAERFAIGREVGFEAIEMRTITRTRRRPRFARRPRRPACESIPS